MCCIYIDATVLYKNYILNNIKMYFKYFKTIVTIIETADPCEDNNNNNNNRRLVHLNPNIYMYISTVSSLIKKN